MKMPCLPRRSNPRQTGQYCVCFCCGLNRRPSKSRINTKVSNFNTLYQNCSPKMAFHATFDTIFIAVGLVTVLRGAVTVFARGVTRQGLLRYSSLKSTVKYSGGTAFACHTPLEERYSSLPSATKSFARILSTAGLPCLLPTLTAAA